MSNSAYTSIPKGEGFTTHEDSHALRFYRVRAMNASGRSATITLIVLVLSILINVLLFVNLFMPTLGIEYSPYTGLALDQSVAYHAHTDYWSDNHTLADEMWESIDTSPIAVALDHTWARLKGLPEAGPFPWDASKGTYFVKAFHQIHCLKLIRRMTIEYKEGRTPLADWAHYDHCLDAIRKDIMCRADDTPMAGHPDKHLGEGQVRQCRDWNKLVAWTQAPERQACYRTLSDYRPIKHTLEQYAFCPPESPYYNNQREYFEKFGHKQAFEANK